MKKRLWATLLVVCMTISLLPTTAFAADSFTVTDAEGNSVAAVSGVYTLTEGSYTATGSMTDTITVTGDTCNLTIRGVDITATDLPAITVKAGATLNLTIEGVNTLQGGHGHAGILVEPAYNANYAYDEDESAALNISGNGTLSAVGGNGDTANGTYGGGAGIGGDGQNGSDGVDFGRVTVANDFTGELNATGGNAGKQTDDEKCYGGGAGIGSGGFNMGTDVDSPYWGKVFGDIEIQNGTIHAKSSETDNDVSAGAGIGGGGAHGNDTGESGICIKISGGNVTADGGICAAGIGGGRQCDGGQIDISGGTIKANAGLAVGPLGASGIGGGENSSVSEVIITGGHIEAVASGGAAGIGGGANTVYSNIHYGDKDGTVSEDKKGIIKISGEDTSVTATGGTANGRSGRYGGAGIGAGYPTENNARSVAFDIEITSGATVNAYGGHHAQAIGYGYRPGSNSSDYYTGYGITLTLDDTVKLWAQNKDCFQPALAAETQYDGDRIPVTYSSEKNGLVCYANADRDAALGTQGEALKFMRVPGDGSSVAWTYQDNKLTVDSSVVKDNLSELNGNWATICAAAKAKISYVLGEGATAPDGVSYDEKEAEINSTVTTKPAPTQNGYVFTGWSDGANVYHAGQKITVDGDLTLTAQWQKIDDWSAKPGADSDGKLDVDVDVSVNVDVAVQVGVSAEVSDVQKNALNDRVRSALTTVMDGETPTGMTDETASDLRGLLNRGASEVEATLTVYAELKETPTEDALKALLDEQFASGETAQQWDLSVTLTTAATAANGDDLGTVTAVITETTPITFTLTTGQDLSGKEVRVLYRHKGAVGTAESSVTDAASGVVQVTAGKFSPYVILSKDKPSSGGGHSSSGGAASYSVSVSDKNPTGGTVRTDKSSAIAGATVTVTVSPESGYVLDRLTVTDKSGKQIALTDKGSGKYTFVMPAGAVTVSAAFRAEQWNTSAASCPKDVTCPIAPFADAQPDAWYHDGVHFCLQNGLMAGYDDDTFRPDAGTTRAMIAVMLWRLNGSPVVNYALPFEDVQPDAWYTEAIRWAVSAGVAQGYGDGSFGPDDVVTREQMVTILWRYAQAQNCDVSVGENTNILSYQDAFSVAEYAVPAMQWACGSGLVSGQAQDGVAILAPQGSTTRAQTATMLMHFCADILK